MKQLTIGYLYPEYMNIYGDTGNIITLLNRGKKREISMKVVEITKGSKLQPGAVDIYFFGGGQDQQQVFVSQDIQRLREPVCTDLEAGAVALTICGGYQLFGEFYRPFQGDDLPGISFFNAQTHASNTRMINNLVVNMQDDLYREISEIYDNKEGIPQTLVGFENHSGQTQIQEGNEIIGETLYGYGNNESQKVEGCRRNNAFGTYMHGSLLPKNPHFADYLLFLALRYRYQTEEKMSILDDEYAYQAHKFIVNKYASMTKK